MADYAHPEALVSTDWVDEHKGEENVVLVEVDVDTNAYSEGHVPGAVGWDWNTQLCDTVQRDIISKENLEKLLGAAGIKADTTIVLYGDNNNWFAAWAFWQLKMYGHQDVRIMNGGRKKWLAEGREVSTDTPTPGATNYTASAVDNSLRAFLSDVKAILPVNGTTLVDVLSPDEFSGNLLSPP